MPSKNKKVARHHMSDSEKKERAQQKLINAYKRQQKWLMWAGIVILILILFLLLVAWYSYDWGNDSTKDALKQNTPTTTTKQSGSGTTSGSGSATGTAGGNGGSGGTTTTGSGGASTADGTNTASTSSEESSSTNNSSTTNNSTTTNNTTTNNNTADQPEGLLTLYADSNVGDTLDSVLSNASSLGLGTDCRIELVVVRVCDIAEGDNVVTVKSLITNDLVTSITKNF